jgi:hypothetical protein
MAEAAVGGGARRRQQRGDVLGIGQEVLAQGTAPRP